MPEIQNVRYTHDAIMDEILMNPAISQGELAKKFNYTQGWMSIIVNSDAFQERLAQRKAALSDPMITASIEERVEGASKRALDKILERLDKPGNLKMMELVAVAKMGVGDRMNKGSAPAQQNNLYVLQMPQPAKDSSAWLRDNVQTAQEVIDLPAKSEK